MRLSADPHHPDYHPMAHQGTVYLNDQPIQDCVYLNEERGFVDLMVRDSNGNLVILPNGKLMINRIFGVVYVRS